ncbi:hypothetical protein ACFPMF_13920 [Larkinella bovis]|uniref:Uncharacterized protein n=1 Tax=Larkinella bovis TaxID=683041 RepID=A0ABW0ID25_9BACT
MKERKPVFHLVSFSPPKRFTNYRLVVQNTPLELRQGVFLWQSMISESIGDIFAEFVLLGQAIP